MMWLEVAEYDEKNRLTPHEIQAPTWDQARGWLAEVTARRRRYAGLTVTAEDGSYLTVDGSDGLFFLLVGHADGTQFESRDPAAPPGEVTITLGGVTTTLPRECLYDEPATLDALRAFWSGNLDTSSGWEPL